MYLSAALCRVQESLQRERATGAALANVRQIARKAANAWGAEALLAEQREQRQVRNGVSVANLVGEKRWASDQLDRALSENPDRGFA